MRAGAHRVRCAIVPLCLRQMSLQATSFGDFQAICDRCHPPGVQALAGRPPIGYSAPSRQGFNELVAIFYLGWNK